MNDRERWEERHREAEFLGEPSSFLQASLPELRRGRALDLACGLGANALLLASEGFDVEARDWSVAALVKLRAAARARGVSIRSIACDVTRLPIAEERYDLVLCMRFLERSLWEPMVHALRPGGALVLETFTRAHRKGKPDFPERYCLEPNELMSALAPRLRVASYRELPSETSAAILAFRESRADRRGAAGGS